MSLAPLLGLPGKVKTLLDRLTATRAGYLDNLDAAVTTRAPSSTALSSATWTSARAGYLDKINTYLDANTGKTKKMFQLITSGSSWTRPAGIVGTTVYVSAIAGGESYSSSGPVYGQGGSYIQRYPYTAGASVSYSVGSGGSGTGGANGTDTVFGTITLQGGGESDCTGALGRNVSTGTQAESPPGPHGSHAAGNSVSRGGGGLMFGGTVYGRGGSALSNDGGAGAILLEWEESV